MVYGETLCHECGEVITEPICEECFEKQIYVWIREKNMGPTEKKAVLDFVKKTTKNMGILPESNFYCIICSRKMNSICSYCLMKITHNKLSDYVEKEELMLVFNFKVHDFGLKRD